MEKTIYQTIQLKRFLRLLLPVGLSLCSLTLAGKGHYQVNDNTRDIYRLIHELKFEEAASHLDLAEKADPENLFYLHLRNYIDFYTLFIGEKERDYRLMEGRKPIRLDRLESGDPRSPYHRLLQAELLLQWAIVRLKFGDYLTAIRETRKAHDLLTENRQLHPEFILNNKGLAMIHAVIGTIPDSYRFLVEWFTGMEGSISTSLEEAEELVRYCESTGHLFRDEAYVIRALIIMHLANEPGKAWESIQLAKLDVVNSPLAGFIQSNIARRAGKTDEAIRILSNIRRNGGRYPFYFIDFMLGLNKLHRLDADAGQYLIHYTTHFTGMNYLKEAYQLLAWHSLVNLDNPSRAQEYYRQCLEQGKMFLDEDKSAYREALSGELPNPLLLKIRLLFDGGYYTRSLALLQDNRKVLLRSNPLEYHYRKARNHQMMGHRSEALASYRRVLDMPGAKKSYQQCNSALQAGIICEESGEFLLAAAMYRKCLLLDPDDYKNSLHQKAKAGLNRIKS